MNGHDRHPNGQALGEEIAALLLGMLDEEKAASLRAHLSECSACRVEYERLRIASDALPLAVTQYRAPAVVEERVMAIVHSEARQRQVDQAPPEPPARVRRPLPRWLTGSRGLAVASSALAVALVVGVLALAGAFSAGVSPSRTIRGQVVGVPAASVVLRLQNGRGQLIIAHMVQPPAGHIYEVWVQRPGRAPQPTSALFGITRHGGAYVAVPGTLSGVQHVLVTAEPLGGSPTPTRSPVIVVSPA